MSLLSNDTIKLYGESVGLRNLKEDVQHLLCHDTEYRLREIIQEASKFMKYSNRCKLTTEDIQAALKLKRVDVSFIPAFFPSSILLLTRRPLTRRS